MRATKAIIHLDNFSYNMNALKEHLGYGAKNDCAAPLICVPVKADAYGHGAAQIASCALAAGAGMLAVASVDEGIELRSAGIECPVLLLSPALCGELEAAAAYHLIPFVSDKISIDDFARAARKQGGAVFLKIETGMGRGGCDPQAAAELAEYIVKQPSLSLAGTATHFAVSDSDDPSDISWTARQIAVFTGALTSIRRAGFDTGIVTAANSGASLCCSGAWFDMVRPGISLYGYQAGMKPLLNLKPVMELVTKVALIKKIGKGDSVSYGRTWTAPYDTHIGILPIGYGDGLPRLLSVRQEDESPFFVVINGEKYPLAGRICMDQCMINLGAELKVQRGDDVTIFGGGAPSLSAADIAERTSTIPYEILCTINKRVPRVYASATGAFI